LLEFNMAHDSFTQQSPTSLKPFISNWARWVSANFVGGLIGWAIVAISILLTIGLSLTIFWLIVGTAVGIAQYHALSKQIAHVPATGMHNSRASIWIGSTILGVLLTFLIMWGVPFFLYSFFINDTELTERRGLFNVLSVVGGLLYGLIQGLLLRWPVKWVILWSLMCAFGWFVGVLIGQQLAQSILSWLKGYNFGLGEGILLGDWDALYIAIAGTLGTIIFGLITGPAIALLRWPKPAPSPLGTPGKPQTARNDPNWS
jgi:hypothetical protein